MKYISLAQKSTKLTFGYDFSLSSSYDDLKVVPANPESSPVQVIGAMGFENSSSIHSGEFIGDSSLITGHFIGSQSSLGSSFDKKCYINIADKSLSDPCGGTFLFSHQKKSKGTEIIFSNYSSDVNDPRGFEIGVNDANKLFFECQSSSGPFVRVLNNLPYGKNIYNVTVDDNGGVVVLSWWDFYEEKFESFSFDVEAEYLNPSSVWMIGSGNYKGEASADYKASGYPCDGYIDKFFHFDEVISEDDSSIIAKSIYENFVYYPEESGQFNAYVTGYETSLDQIVEGVTGFEEVITGYTPLVYDSYQYVTGENLYGSVVSGDYYYELYQNTVSSDFVSGDITGVYKSIVADSPSYEITGFATGYNTISNLIGGGEPMYFNSGVSGELYRTYIDSPLYADGGFYKTKDAYYDLETGLAPISLSDSLPGYGPRSYTYLGKRDSALDFIETQKGINMFSVNNFAGISPSDKCLNPVVAIDEVFTFDNESVSLVVNGVTKEKGQISFNQSQNIFELSSGEFCIFDDGEEKLINNKEVLFDDKNLSLYVDDPLVDIVKPYSFKSLVINNLNQYSAVSFSEIEPSSKNIFFNGQKIYEGIDYEFDSGRFKPIGDILNITGVYHSFGDWNYDVSASSTENVTGLGLYDIHESSPFLPSSYVSYLNGIRLDPKAFVMHDHTVDLIEQGKNFIAGKQYYEIYNNYDIDRLSQDVASAGGVAVTGEDWTIMGTVDVDGTVLDEYGNAAPPGTLPLEYDPEQVTSQDFDV